MDPFEEFLKEKQAQELIAKGLAAKPASKEEEEEASRREDDARMTWTGKRVRGAGGGPGSSARDNDDEDDDEGSTGGVGKYLKATLAGRSHSGDVDEIVEVVEDEPDPEPVRKKVKGTGGFGDFSSW